MKSLERRFKNISNKHPDLSSYVCFFKAVENQRFSKDIVRRWFNKLVDKDDYESKEKRSIVRDMVASSNPAEEHQN